MAEKQSDSRQRSTSESVLRKFLMPIVATAASAAASYAAKKGPELFEEKVLPRLRAVRDESGRVAARVPSQAQQALTGAGDLAEGLTDRVRSVADSGREEAPRRSSSLSQEQLAERRAERSQRRDARRKRERRHRDVAGS